MNPTGGERSDAPMTNMTKLYWAAFAAAIAFLVVNRVNIYFKTKQSKEELAEELAENRRAMQEALEVGGEHVYTSPHSSSVLSVLSAQALSPQQLGAERSVCVLPFAPRTATLLSRWFTRTALPPPPAPRPKFVYSTPLIECVVACTCIPSLVGGEELHRQGGSLRGDGARRD